MTLGELLEYLDTNTSYAILDGSVGETLEKARGGTHREPLVGELVSTIMARCEAERPESEVERAAVVNAIGPLRLKYMADDAPVEAFRLVEGVVPVIDSAFNEEALRQQGKI